MEFLGGRKRKGVTCFEKKGKGGFLKQGEKERGGRRRGVRGGGSCKGLMVVHPAKFIVSQVHECTVKVPNFEH